ncbi:hypothetical protein VOLCADRAFT_106648, partial [Volvox carteri f. nagariensis]
MKPGSDTQRTAQILDIRLRDAAGLTCTLALVSKYFDDNVCLEVHQTKGLQVRAIDQAKCSFVDAFFPASTAHGLVPVFSRFDCDRAYFPMWIAPALLGRAIRTATEGHHLVLEAEVAAGSGQRSLGVVKSTRQELALLTPTTDALSCFVDGDAFTFTAEALFEAPDLLADILSDVRSSGCEEVSLALGPSSLQLSGRAGDNCSNLQVSLRGSAGPGMGALSLNAPKGTVQTHFKAGAPSAAPIPPAGEEAPLSATFELHGGGTCQIFIAPCLEDELQDEEKEGQGFTSIKAAEVSRRPGKRCVAEVVSEGCSGGSSGAGDGGWGVSPRGRVKRAGAAACDEATVPYNGSDSVLTVTARSQ